MDKITLHMELTAEAYETLQRDGYLVSSPSLIEDRDWLPAYRWLTAKMIERLPASDRPQEPWPLWAWLRQNGKDKGFRVSKPGHWMVKFEKPVDQVLLSDYLKWHAPLNRTPYHDYDADEEAAEHEYQQFQDLLAGEGFPDLDQGIEMNAIAADGATYAHVWDFVHRTWERVLDVDGSLDIQTTFWRLDVSEVISARQRSSAIRK